MSVGGNSDAGQTSRTGPSDKSGGANSGGASNAGGSYVAGANTKGGDAGANSIGATGGFNSTGGAAPIGGTATVVGTNSTGGFKAATGTNATGGNSNTGGLSATGGTATRTDATKLIGGATNSGASSVMGGVSAQTGGASTSGGASSTGGSSDTGGTGVTVPLVGSCTAPCSANLQTSAEYTSLQASNGATLFYDSTTGQLTLRNDPDQAASTATPLLIFTYSSTEGYSVWTQGNVWFAFTENYDYSTDYTGYSLQLNNVVTADMVDAKTGQMYIIKFSLQADSVTIAEARLASCNAMQGTTCQNATDCPNVTSGQIPSLSSACAACYTAFNACSATYCPTDCPGHGGNACMMCQTDNGCHTDFMQCSGLDYMPPGTLTLPGAL